ncbi:MAG: FAD-dependent monooxygenase [Pseudomonadota bacterium]|nr:FAD-dependent monooxygenase [Pseudomonadota bacterium]
MEQQRLKIAIVGAGLNGLALALSLRKFGIQARVYEKAAQPRADGTGIIMWPEGMQVLAALVGVDKVKAACNQVDTTSTLTATGLPINTLNMSDSPSKANAPIGLFHRSRLYQLLLDELGDECIATNQHCTVVENGEQSQILINGEPLDADIIVGADGVFSQVRKFVAPEVSLRQPNVYCCRGEIDFKAPEISDKECYVFAGDKSRIVTYTYDRETQGKYWFAACAVEEGETLSKQTVLKQFSHYPSYLLDMIRDTPESKILPSPLTDVAPFDTWYRDNAVLLGDACCAVLPTMGIGFSLGIENAYVLAQSIASNFEGTEQAFKRYQQRAQQRSHELQNITHRLSELTYKDEFNPVEVAELYQQFAIVNSRSPF